MPEPLQGGSFAPLGYGQVGLVGCHSLVEREEAEVRDAAKPLTGHRPGPSARNITMSSAGAEKSHWTSEGL